MPGNIPNHIKIIQISYVSHLFHRKLNKYNSNMYGILFKSGRMNINQIVQNNNSK